MALPEFTLHQPRTLKNACSLLAKYFPNARVIAGGTDLLIDLAEGEKKAEHLISLEKISRLKFVKEKNGFVHIGALVTAREIAENKVLKKKLPALCEAAASMASYQIRAMATIGGNIASAVPSADLPPILLATEADVAIAGRDGDKRIKLEDFFLAPRETILKTGEIIKEIIIPPLPKGTGSAYSRFSYRGANALAVVGVAARVSLDRARITDARIALGAVAPTPILARKAQISLLEKFPTEENILNAATIASNEAKPITDIRGSAEFRREQIVVQTKRALETAIVRAK